MMKRIPEYQPGHLSAINSPGHQSTEEIHQDFFIHPLAIVEHGEAMPPVPHRKTVNDLVLVTKGRLEEMVCSDVFKLREGTIMLLPPYKIRSVLHYSKNITGYHCHFSDQFVSGGPGLKGVKEIFHHTELTNAHAFHLDGHHQKRIAWLLDQMLCLYENGKGLDLLKLYLFTVVGEMTHFVQSLPTPVFSSTETVSQRFRKLVTHHIQHTHSIHDYAEWLHVSPNHLNKCVKSTTGKTASDIINEALLMEAKALLWLPQHNIAEVAFSIGFEDLSYFSRFFKKHTGHSPSDYRKMIGLS